MNTRSVIETFLKSFNELKGKWSSTKPLTTPNDHSSHTSSKTKQTSVGSGNAPTYLQKQDGDEEPEKNPNLSERNEPISGVSQPALVSLLKGLVNYVKKTGQITDFHGGNFGVIPSNSSRESDTFVFFDI